MNSRLIHLLNRFPALFALLSFSVSRYLGWHWAILLSSACFILLWRKQAWWLILLIALGYYANTQDLKQGKYWQELFKHKGYVQMKVQWDEDTYLNQQDNVVSGWAWVWPDTPKGHSLEKRFWIKVKHSTSLDREDLMLGTQFQAKLFLDGSEKRRLMFVAPEKETLSTPWAYQLRSQLVQRLETGWGIHQETERASLMRGMITGNRDGLPDDVHAGFSRLGLLHLLALSGLHVGILFFFLSSLFAGFGRPSFKAKCLAFCVVLIYGLLGGWAHSLKRAICMCGLSLWADDLGRRYNMFNVLCFLAFFEIALDPNVIYSLSFQLSYLGVLGIAWSWYVLRPKWTKSKSTMFRMKESISNSYRTSWGAMLFTWPVVALRFSVIPIWVWLFSIPLLLLFSIVVISSFIGACLTLSGVAIPELVWFPLEFYQKLVSLLSSHFSWVQAIEKLDANWMLPYYVALFTLFIWKSLCLKKEKDSDLGPLPPNA